ncbi:Flavonoid-6-hydroxylase-like protein, partial [Drosera capensis]
MVLALASLLHGFDIRTPSDEPVDMTESPGMSNLKATPLEVRISPRLPTHVYNEIHEGFGARGSQGSGQMDFRQQRGADSPVVCTPATRKAISGNRDLEVEKTWESRFGRQSLEIKSLGELRSRNQGVSLEKRDVGELWKASAMIVVGLCSDCQLTGGIDKKIV